MRNSWWLAPVAVILLLAGVAGGMWLARPKDLWAGTGDRVSIPPLPGDKKADKPAVQPTQSQPKPAQPQPKPDPGQVSQKPAPAPEVKRPPDAEALAFMYQFMNARVSGDAAKVTGMVAPDAPGKGAIRVSKAGLRMTGYMVEMLGSGDADSFIFRTKVAFATAQPGSEVAAEHVRVAWKGGFQVAAYEERTAESLAVRMDPGGNLQAHRGDDTALAGDMNLLPAEASPWGAGPDVKFGVGKDEWAVAAVSLSGSHVLWVTRGLHPLVGVSQLEWGGAPAITPLDLLFEAGGVEAAWSPAGSRYVALTVAQPSGNTMLIIYDLSSGQRFGPDLPNVFGTQDFAVQNLRWLVGGTTVTFDVARGGTVTGPWTYNVSTRTLAGP